MKRKSHMQTEAHVKALLPYVSVLPARTANTPELDTSPYQRHNDHSNPWKPFSALKMSLVRMDVEPGIVSYFILLNHFICIYYCTFASCQI